MNETAKFISQHGYSVLFAWVVAEQLGVPVPALPMLLAVGVLAASHQINLWIALLIAVSGCLLADLAWYEIGRHRGISVLRFLCRISLEPESCVRQTKLAFSRHGLKSLLVAKFIPGLSTAATPLAGISHITLPSFLLFDAMGALLWAGSFMFIGFWFSREIERVLHVTVQIGGWLAGTAAIGLALYLVWKFFHRQRFMRELRIARIEPEELKQMMDEGQEVVIVDLRHPVEFEAEPESIVGALRMSPDNLENHRDKLPRDRDVILYCS